MISNAIKFTPEQGEVRVGMRGPAATLSIEVRDSGPGIAPELLPFVFDRFRQGDSRSTRRHGGLGLGLAIARHLVECHGGTIDAHSDGVGSGDGSSSASRLPLHLALSEAGRRAPDRSRSSCPAATCWWSTIRRTHVNCWSVCSINVEPGCSNAGRRTPRSTHSVNRLRSDRR